MSIQRHSETLMDHFQAPRNRRCLPRHDAVGVAGVPGQGPYLVLYLRICGERIVEAAFQSNGCGVTIACGSMLTELLTGKTLTDCRDLTPEALTDSLGGIPVHRRDRAAFAISALWDALGQATSFERSCSIGSP
jgi:NifU-like protein involved in Fe-S cluster formation